MKRNLELQLVDGSQPYLMHLGATEENRLRQLGRESARKQKTL